MRRRSRVGSEPPKTRRRKTVTLKRGIAPKTVRRRSSSAAGPETEVARLTRELNESLERRAATGDVLKVISRSTFHLQTVLTTLTESAARLCVADKGVIFQRDGELYRLGASYGYSSEMEQRPDHIVGALVVRRKTPGEFPKATIDLLQTFADQSVVAIQNARLFENADARARELAKSLEDLRTAQDRLVQTEKLASLGQLTAGIAHEIKNPLNFVNNFSGVSVELIDELQEALADFKAEDKKRTEIAELTDTLRGNLEKIVQHGKRADAIVKNMLLHSRQGSGEHRPVDINALVDESLNLAYHGARAEKQGFTITMERSFDPTAGEVDLFPQEITRVLLNLISNGFYAATKRKAEADGGVYELRSLPRQRISATASKSGYATMAPAYRPR
jgi:two-component system, NtrC family, sensor kinase